MSSSNNSLTFGLGVILGFLFYQCLVRFYVNETDSSNLKLVDSYKESSNGVSFELYENVLAERLYNEVRIVCWINMLGKYHKTKAIHIKNTWGRRCNKLIFMSNEDDPDLSAVKLPVEDGLDHFWMKFKLAYQHVFKHHFNDGDWFLKGDDDTYVVMENLRAMLYQYRPQTSLMFGHRMAGQAQENGFMQGGCYIMSKKLLTKFVKKLSPNVTACGPVDGYTEDVYMGKSSGFQIFWFLQELHYRPMRWQLFDLHRRSR